jgi:DNA-binding MltR family transcriptional regulator
MAKKSKVPPDVAAFAEAIAMFTKQTDRGCALVAAAWVDDALAAYVRAVLRPEQQLADQLFQSEGPLGTFSSHIKIAYMLGLIEQYEYKDLEIIRSIRNEFAHVRQNLRFTTQHIKARCNNLHAAKAFHLGAGSAIRSPRQKFLLSVYFLADCLLSSAKEAKPPDVPLGDPYGMWIRRVAKSMSLVEVGKALKEINTRNA